MGLTIVAVPTKKKPQHDFGRRLTALRLARGLTQTQLAVAVGASQRAISRLETIAEFPTVALLVALCHTLKASADELLGLRPSKQTPAPQPPEEKRLWRHLKRVAALPERDRRAVLRIIDSASLARSARASG
jgi:transcriptional regulator with XRE-family HTH domain